MTAQLKDPFQLLLDEFYEIIDGYPEIEKITSKLNEPSEKG